MFSAVIGYRRTGLQASFLFALMPTPFQIMRHLIHSTSNVIKPRPSVSYAAPDGQVGQTVRYLSDGRL